MGCQRHAQAALFPGKQLLPIVQEDVWSSGQVLMVSEIYAPTGVRTPNRPPP
jgi:hypothetical protein